MNLNGGLAVSSGGEDLALAGGDGGVAVNQTGEHAAHGLDAQGQGGNVQQQHVGDVAGENAALHSCAQSHALVGVDALEALLAGDALDGILHGGDTGGAANQQNLMQVGSGDAGVGHGLTDRLQGALDQVSGHFVVLGAGDGHIQVLGAGGVSGDIGQVDVGGGHAGQLNLGLLSSLLQALHGNTVLGQVDALGLLELGNQVIHDPLVEVVAAQTGVTGGGQNLESAVADIQDGHVEGAAAQVVDHDLLVHLLVHAVSQSGCGGLVDDALDIQTGDLACVLGSLTLGVGEVSGNGDDSLGDGLAQVSLSVLLQLGQDHGADLLRGVALAVDVNLVVFAHVALDGCDGAVGIGDSLTLGHLTDHTLAGLGECHNRGSGAGAFGVGDDNRLAAFQNSHAGIGSTQVDTDNLRHNVFLLYSN